MSLVIPLKNQCLSLQDKQISRVNTSTDEIHLDREDLIEVIKRLVKLHNDGALDDEDFKGVIQLALSQYIEDEVDRRLSASIEHKLTQNRFLNILL